MLKKDITYEDFDGNKVTETFYFNLTKPELLELEASYKEGMENALKKMLAEEDKAALLAYFKKTILAAYGEKSADGKRFIKSEELTTNFTQTNAYAELYMELLSDSESAALFITGIVPSDLAQAVNAEELKQNTAKALGLEEKNNEGNAEPQG